VGVIGLDTKRFFWTASKLPALPSPAVPHTPDCKLQAASDCTTCILASFTTGCQLGKPKVPSSPSARKALLQIWTVCTVLRWKYSTVFSILLVEASVLRNETETVIRVQACQVQADCFKMVLGWSGHVKSQQAD